MFGSLRKKLNKVIDRFSHKVEEEAEIEEGIQPKEEKLKDEPRELALEDIGPDKEKKSLFGKISNKFTKVRLSEQKFDKLFWELELLLLENNLAVEVIEKIKQDLKRELVDKELTRSTIEEHITNALKDSITDLYDYEKIDLVKEAKKKKPYVIAFMGVNGSGKTTTLVKLAYLFTKKDFKVVAGACDTFRAAAIHQLEEHTKKIGVKLIKQDYGSDAAAVAYDTLSHARAKRLDIVLLDTGGRLHANKNLMDELRKLLRVAEPDLKIFVGESITGNDVVEQIKIFDKEVGVDAVILTKADVDEKGGAAISVSYVTGKPILYFGVGQNYTDLIDFSKEELLKNVGLI